MYRILISLFFSLAILSANSQNNSDNYKKYNVVIIAGKKYIIHIVKRGETLFNISKKYNVSYESVEKANPFIIPTSLEIGVAIKIPYNQEQITEEIEKKEIPDTTNSPTLYHIVKQGETVFRIALLYGIKPNDIFKINPGSEITIHPNQRLKIPAHLKSEIIEIEQDEEFIFHTAKSNETLSYIAEKYGTKTKILRKANPNLSDTNIPEGTIIRIPKEKVDIITQLPHKLDSSLFHYHLAKPQETLFGLSRLYKISIDQIKEQNPALKERDLLAGEIIKLELTSIVLPQLPDITSIETDSIPLPIVEEKCPCIEKQFEGVMKVGLILPFYTNINDTLTQSESRFQIFSRSEQFIEFYQGLLIALQDLKEQGLSIELQVFDSQNNSDIITDITNNIDFNSLDLLIGPVFSKQIEAITPVAKKHNIPIISPLSVDEKFLLDYENAFMVSPSQGIQDQESIEFLSKLKSNSFVVIFDGNQYDSTYIPALKSKIFNRYTSENIHNLKYSEFAYFKGEEEKLMELFTNQDTTVVIIPSSNKAFVSDIVARLNTLSATQTIILFGQPRWTRYENIKLEFFHNLNTHLFALSYLDYSNEKIIEFIQKYRKYYNTEPDSRAYEGYDITKYFIEALHKYSKDFRHCLEDFSPELLHMNLKMKQLNPKSGYINHNMFLLHFNRNFKIETIMYSPTKVDE